MKQKQLNSLIMFDDNCSMMDSSVTAYCNLSVIAFNGITIDKRLNQYSIAYW